MLEALRIIFALFLLFFLPGYMLVQALFPRKGELDQDFDWLYRITLGMGLSIVLTIFVCFGLNSLGVSEETGMGYVTAWPITISLLLLSLILFFIAWFRGAFPVLGRIHPALIRFPSRDPRNQDIPAIGDKKIRFHYQDLLKKKFRLIKEINNTERLIDTHSAEQMRYYEERRGKLVTELGDLDKQIKVIEKGIEPERDNDE
jgi:hypothetical protein